MDASARVGRGGIGAMLLATSVAGDAAVRQKEGGPMASWVAHELGAAHEEICIVPSRWKLLTVITDRKIQADLETPDAS